MKKDKKNNNLQRDLLEIGLTCLGIFLIFNFVIMSVKISGKSMQPTYNDGERGIMLRNNFLNNINYNDIVVINLVEGEKETLIVKRVIALPNDSVEIKDNKVYVNDLEIIDNHRANDTLMLDQSKIKLTENQYFILGDNRNVSKDSRKIGPVEKEDIVAIKGITYWPLDKIKIME